MNIIQLKNEVSRIESKVKHDLNNFHQHIQKANNDILFYTEAIHEKMMTYLLMIGKKQMRSEMFEDLLQTFMRGREQKFHMVEYYVRNRNHYSRFNVIVYMKRIWKQYRQLHRQFKRLRQTLINDLGEIKDLVQRIKQSKKQNKHTIQALETLNDLHYHILRALTLELNTIDFRHYVEHMFIGENEKDSTITKNEMLSLLALDHSKRTQDYIRNLPERIDRDTFLDAVFVDKIEDEWNDTFGEMIFDSMMIAKDRDPKLRKRMLDKIDEIFEGKLPMYRATYDEYLQPVKLERMKPKLRLVKK